MNVGRWEYASWITPPPKLVQKTKPKIVQELNESIVSHDR